MLLATGICSSKSTKKERLHDVKTQIKQKSALLILSTIALSVGMGVIFRQFAGSTFYPLLDPSTSIFVTLIYTLAVFIGRYKEGILRCYMAQVILAAIVGIASNTDLAQMGQKMDWSAVTCLTLVTMMAHNMCVDRILHRLGKIDSGIGFRRIISSSTFSVLSIVGYASYTTQNPSDLVVTKKNEVVEVAVPKAIQVIYIAPKTQGFCLDVSSKVKGMFESIYQSITEHEVSEQTDNICEYPREWIEQLKKFENEPLYSGELAESKVHTDKLRSDILEVGYGTTPDEITDAKYYGFLKEDAEFPRSMTKEEADKWMEEVTIPTYDAMVKDKVKVELTLKQRFALLSFCHNTGSGNLEKLACQDNRINSGNFESAPGLIRLYVNAGKHKNVKGLVRRRNWEANLFEESLGEIASN